MLLYSDIISGDKMISDAFYIKLVGDVLYEVDCEMIAVKDGADIDIGVNPSAEEQREALEEGVWGINNIVYSFRLQPTTFDKKSFLTYLKGYTNKLKAQFQSFEPDRVDAFEKGAQAFTKVVSANFGCFEFYTGESMNPDGMVALLNYRGDGVTPYFTFWKDGLKEVKAIDS